MGPKRFFGRALPAWLALMSFHSIVLGVAIYLLAESLLPSLGFDLSGGAFYPRQSGVFLVILGAGYGLAAADPGQRRPLVFLAIFSKAMAVLFLYSEALLRGVPFSILAAGTGDALLGGMALVLAVAFYRERRESS